MPVDPVQAQGRLPVQPPRQQRVRRFRQWGRLQSTRGVIFAAGLRVRGSPFVSTALSFRDFGWMIARTRAWVVPVALLVAPPPVLTTNFSFNAS